MRSKMKVCKTCDQEKSTTEYYRTHGYLEGECKSCKRDRKLAREQKEKETELYKPSGDDFWIGYKTI